jgi:hypothetical protein
MPLLPVLIELLLTDAPNMGYVHVIRNSLFSSRIVVTLVQAQVLRFFLGWLGTLNHHGIKCRAQQTRIVDVGSTHHDCQWTATGFD